MSRIFNRYKTVRKTSWLGVILVLVLFWGSVFDADIDFRDLFRGFPSALDFIARMLPPDFTDWKIYFQAAIETLEIAVVGTMLATAAALPLSFFGARNIIASKLLHNLIRSIFDVCRGISEIVLGLLFVAAVGLGPFSGAMALAVHELGALGRYFSEAVENIPAHVLDIGKSSGANKLQIISRIIIPEIRPLLIGYVLYYFEHSVRAATVLGLVGAGGIGFLLVVRVKLFLYREVAAILIVTILLVIASDRISFWLRSRSRKISFQE